MWCLFVEKAVYAYPQIVYYCVAYWLCVSVCSLQQIERHCCGVWVCLCPYVCVWSTSKHRWRRTKYQNVLNTTEMSSPPMGSTDYESSLAAKKKTNWIRWQQHVVLHSATTIDEKFGRRFSNFGLTLFPILFRFVVVVSLQSHVLALNFTRFGIVNGLRLEMMIRKFIVQRPQD